MNGFNIVTTENILDRYINIDRSELEISFNINQLAHDEMNLKWVELNYLN